jgi:hypothetical protein
VTTLGRSLRRRLRWLLRRSRLLPARWRESALINQGDGDDPANWLSLDYVHEQVQAQLKAQEVIWEAVDGRLRLILGVIGIVFAAAAAFQRAAGGGPLLPFWVGAGVSLAVSLFLLAAIIAGVSYWPYDFDRPPQPHRLRERYLTTDPREVMLAVVDTILVAYTNNAAVIERKNLAFKRAFVLTATATALLGIALAIQVACQTASPDWWWPWPRSGC